MAIRLTDDERELIALRRAWLRLVAKWDRQDPHALEPRVGDDQLYLHLYPDQSGFVMCEPDRPLAEPWRLGSFASWREGVLLVERLHGDDELCRLHRRQGVGARNEDDCEGEDAG